MLAETALSAGLPSGAASAAYYAMLYAVRAALSEEDRNAKTHKGAWDMFRETFGVGGGFDERLLAEARSTQRLREAADYDAREVTTAEAEAVVDLARRFCAAVEEMLAAESSSHTDR